MNQASTELGTLLSTLSTGATCNMSMDHTRAGIVQDSDIPLGKRGTILHQKVVSLNRTMDLPVFHFGILDLLVSLF